MDQQHIGKCSRVRWSDYRQDVLDVFWEVNRAAEISDLMTCRQNFMAAFPDYASHTEATTVIQVEMWLHAQGIYSAEWIADYAEQLPAEYAISMAPFTPVVAAAA